MTDENLPAMDYRSIALLRSWTDRDLLELASNLGFNTVEFINGGASSHIDFRKLAEEEALFQWANEFDMSLALWIREFDDYNHSFWGEPTLDNKHLWTGIRRRYEALSEFYPEIDYYVLKTVESHEWITDPRMLEKLIRTINEACREHGKTLIYRSFIWHPEQLDAERQVISNLPDDIDIMTKCVGNDWNYRASHHPLLGEMGDKEQYAEIDIASEYHRVDDVANAFTEEIKDRYDDWLDIGINGVHVRPSWTRRRDRDMSVEDPESDRPWAIPTVYGKAQEANLWAIGCLATGESNDMDEIWNEFATKRFGEDIADRMTEALRPTGEVVEEALCVDRETFGDPRERIPAMMTMEDRTAEKRTDEEAEDIPALFKRYLAGEETPRETTNSFQLDTNPFARNWSTWRWDPTYRPTYHKLRKGHPAIIIQKEDDYRNAKESAVESLALLKTIEDNLPEDGGEYFKFKLEENNFLLDVMFEMEMAWLKASNRLYFDESNDHRQASLEDVEAHLEQLENYIDRYNESTTCTWRGITYELERGAYIDIQGYIDEFRRYWELTA